jgi:hypothetical protein
MALKSEFARPGGSRYLGSARCTRGSGRLLERMAIDLNARLDLVFAIP